MRVRQPGKITEQDMERIAEQYDRREESRRATVRMVRAGRKQRRLEEVR